MARVREHFPSLAERDDGAPRIYLDNPAGTQVPRQVMARVEGCYRRANANLGGEYPSSRLAGDLVVAAHQKMADFLGASSVREIVFGPNMTTLAFALSRSLGGLLEAGDEILLTRMEHDANVRPWEILAEERGCVVRRLDFDSQRYELDLDSLDDLVSERTRLAAVGLASNVLGTINDVAAIAGKVRAAGGLTFVDAVHFAPHAPIDVGRLGCDLLACSPYKFFGPHLGVLWGREEVLERLRPYKLGASPDELPWRFETGTQSHEAMAGLLGTFEYLEWLGRETGGGGSSAAMRAIRAWEGQLVAPLLAGLGELAGVRVHGITEPSALDRRVPTVSITVQDRRPDELARRLGEQGVFVTHGDGYARSVVERLGSDASGGVLRLGLAHYNTPYEVEAVLGRLREMATF